MRGGPGLIGGINGLLAYGSLTEIREISRRRAISTLEEDRSQRTIASSATPGAQVSNATPANKTSTGEYNKEEQREIARLKARDREVRAHEDAHKAAAGMHARGAPRYGFTTGPDGRRYASEGSVSIDTSKVAGDPEKTLAKMQQVRRAALAPAEPSSQDARVAAEAAQKAAEARSEISLAKSADIPGAMPDDRDAETPRLQATPVRPNETSLRSHHHRAKHAYISAEREYRVDTRA
ncbi:MAG: hypothetical protein GY944_18310 [bacterium]|nr:hypothetical protein [bacterium]